METKIKIGEIYEVNSIRKGKFTIKVTSVDSDFVTGIIVKGKAKAMMSYNEKEEGEIVSLRIDLTSFKLI